MGINKHSKKPRVGLLLYGVLNTHLEINKPDSERLSIAKTMIELANASLLELDIFVHTEDKCFFKWTPQEHVSADTVWGFPKLEWIEERYCVCQYDKSQIEADLRMCYSHFLKEAVILENTFDRNAWSGSTQRYQDDETTNRWRNTMITTFLKRKKLVYEMAAQYATINSLSYDVLAIVRPDSYIQYAHNRESLGTQLISIINTLSTQPDPMAVYHLCSVNRNTFIPNESEGMMANDFIFGNLPGIKAKVSLIDEISNTHNGNYFKIYPELVYRCDSCKHIQRYPEQPESCPVCFKNPLTLVTEWPEYKMFRHMIKNNVIMSEAPFFGKVLR